MNYRFGERTEREAGVRSRFRETASIRYVKSEGKTTARSGCASIGSERGSVTFSSLTGQSAEDSSYLTRLFLNNQTHTLFFSFVSLLIEKFFDEFLSLHEPSSLVPSFSRICTNCSMNERRPVVRHGGPTTNRHDFINRLRRHDVFA